MQGFWPAHGCPLPQEMIHAKSAEDIVLSSVLPALKIENLKIMEITLKLLYILGRKKDRSVGILCNALVLQGSLFLFLSVTLT